MIEFRLLSGELLDVNFQDLDHVSDARGQIARLVGWSPDYVKLIDSGGDVLLDLQRIHGWSHAVVTVCLSPDPLEERLAITCGVMDFADLRSWESTDLRYDDLKALPYRFGQLQSLRVLDLHQNSLTWLPDSFVKLASLEHLDLRDNRFCDLGMLAILDLQGNRLTELPDSFGKLSALETLLVSHNFLSVLPACFGELYRLRILKAEGNRLTAVPASLALLGQLEVVDLRNNALRCLPHGLPPIRERVDLQLSGNHPDLAHRVPGASGAGRLCLAV
ncbi:unnamed protein product, partial [Prorocentrum cordatum]